MNQGFFTSGKTIIWGLFILLFILHQDFWWWDDPSFISGFLPIGLAFHALFSIACSILGWFAIKYAWPDELEKFADDENDEKRASK